MNFEPQKFFIGLTEFFSILLPGALLTYLLKDDVGPCFWEDGYDKLSGSEGWIVFLFSSYLLGHFIFLLGSGLLDDHVYDKIRKATYEEQVKRLAKGEKLSPGWARWLAERLIKKGSDRAVNQAVRIKEHYLNPLQASSAINAFQWCKARLTLEHPEALATVQRFEADSKFFRSLFVVLSILIPLAAVASRETIALFSMPLLVLAFMRYVDQRVKATSQAYWYVITVESQREGGYRQPAHSRLNEATHAGGVVFRRVGDHVEYLLVQAKNAPQEWVLPKGHVESEEQIQEAAVREVREETGVWARIEFQLNRISLIANRETLTVQFYLMEAVASGKPLDERMHVWLPLNEAMDRASHQESRELLKLAGTKANSASQKH